MTLLAELSPVIGSAAGIVVVFALGSVVFLCAVLLVAAVMLRKKWDDIGDSHTRRR